MGVIKDTLGTLGAKAVNGLMNAGEALIRGGAKAVQNLSKMSEKQLESIGTQNITPQGGVIYNDKSLNNPITMDSKSKANLDHIKNDINLINYEVENPNKTTMRVGNDIIKAIEVTNDTNIKSANRIDKKLDSMAIDIYKSLGYIGANGTNGDNINYSNSSMNSNANDSYERSQAAEFLKGLGVKVIGPTLWKIIKNHPIGTVLVTALAVAEAISVNNINKIADEHNSTRNTYGTKESQDSADSSRTTLNSVEKRIKNYKSVKFRDDSLSLMNSNPSYSDKLRIYKFINNYMDKLGDKLSDFKTPQEGKDFILKLYENPMNFNEKKGGLKLDKDYVKWWDRSAQHDEKIKSELIKYSKGVIIYLISNKYNGVYDISDFLLSIDSDIYSYDNFKSDFKGMELYIKDGYKSYDYIDGIFGKPNLERNKTSIDELIDFDVGINRISDENSKYALTKFSESDDGFKELTSIVSDLSSIKSTNKFSELMKLSISIFNKLISIPDIKNYNQSYAATIYYDIVSTCYNKLNPKLKKSLVYMLDSITPDDKELTSFLGLHSRTLVIDPNDTNDLGKHKGESSVIYIYALFTTLFLHWAGRIQGALESDKVKDELMLLDFICYYLVNTIKSNDRLKGKKILDFINPGVSNYISGFFSKTETKDMLNEIFDSDEIKDKEPGNPNIFKYESSNSPIIGDVNTVNNIDTPNNSENSDTLNPTNPESEMMNKTVDSKEEYINELMNNYGICLTGISLGIDELAKLVKELGLANMEGSDNLDKKIQDLGKMVINGTLKQHLSEVKSSESITENEIINGGSL